MAARDILIIGVILFTIAVGFFIIKFTADTIVSRMVAIPLINQSTATVEALQGANNKLNVGYDYLLLGLFIGLSLALIITGWFIGGEPIFAFIYILIVILGTVFSTVLSYVWNQITGMAVFGSTLAGMPISNHLISYLPLYIAIVGFIGLVVMFAKPKSNDGGLG